MAEKMTAEKALETIAAHTDALAHTATKAELKEVADKAKADFDEAQKVLRELTRQPVFDGGANRFKDVRIPKACMGDVKSAHKHLMGTRAAKGSDLARYHTITDGLLLHATQNSQAKLRNSPLYKEWKAWHEDLATKVAMDTTSESEWFPAEAFSQTLIDRVRDAAHVAASFTRFPMAQKVVKLPLLTADGTVYLIGEGTVAPDDSANTIITSSQPTAAQASLTAIKLAMRVVQSTEMVEEVTFDTAEWLSAQVAMVMAEAIDDVIINGDTAGTHMDANVTGATHRKKAWLGLRAMAVDQSYTVAGGGNALAASELLASRKAMGRYGGFAGAGGGVVHFLNYQSYADLLADTAIKTIDVYGSAATIVQGEVAQVWGQPIVVTEWLLEDMGTSGFNATTTDTTTGVLTANRAGFVLGDRRAISVKSSDIPHMDYDMTTTVGTWRGVFEDTYPIASSHTVDYIVNVT